MDENKKASLCEAYMGGKHSIETPTQTQNSTTDKLQAPTPSENTLKTSLVAALETLNEPFEISHQEVISVKRSTLKKVLKNYNRLDLLPKELCIPIRPDFFCPKYGFAIEVDGNVHHNNSHRAKRDERRDYIYKALGIVLFRIDNDQVHTPKRRSSFLQDIVAWIKQVKKCPNFAKGYSARRKMLSEARKLYRQSYPEKAYLLGSFNSSNPKLENYPTLSNKTTIQNAGYRIQIKPKTKTY